MISSDQRIVRIIAAGSSGFPLLFFCSEKRMSFSMDGMSIGLADLGFWLKHI